jgi:Fe-S cluster assembly iron-binding protein IscA
LPLIGERINILLKITDTARDKIKEILHENPGKYLRVTVEAG